MEYVGAEPEPGCLFCRVLAAPASQDAANLVVWRPPGALVLLNRFPYNSGHVMVAPAAHQGSPELLSEADAVALHRALGRTLDVLRQELRPQGFNLGANLGRTSGAGIPDHYHLHVVPRWDGDTNFMPVLAAVKVVNEHLQTTAEKLRKAFSAGGRGARRPRSPASAAAARSARPRSGRRTGRG